LEPYLLEAKAGRTVIHLSFTTLTAVEYITTQERSALDAAAVLAKMKAWPVQWLHASFLVSALPISALPPGRFPGFRSSVVSP